MIHKYLALSPLIFTCALALAAAAAKKPNIIFIFTDDHGSQAISAYGSNRNTTPDIDRIANEGIRFASHFRL